MTYRSTIVVVDDNTRVLENFQDKAEANNVAIKVFESWDLAKEHLETNLTVDGIVLDAKGKLTADKQESSAHLQQALTWISVQEGKGRIVPYAVHTAFFDDMEAFSGIKESGKMFRKGPKSEIEVLKFLQSEIQKTPKLKLIRKYPEPFASFGVGYLDKRYEEYLIGIITIFEDGTLTNPEQYLFNPCRVILERVFEKINEEDETVLPYALLNFERQRAGLLNCHKHISGIPYYIDNVREAPRNFLKDSGSEYISKQLDLIITTCHPASHDIQARYNAYTFKSVLWALFDVLIWLKAFIDERK